MYARSKSKDRVYTILMQSMPSPGAWIGRTCILYSMYTRSRNKDQVCPVAHGCTVLTGKISRAYNTSVGRVFLALLYILEFVVEQDFEIFPKIRQPILKQEGMIGKTILFQQQSYCVLQHIMRLILHNYVESDINQDPTNTTIYQHKLRYLTSTKLTNNLCFNLNQL